MALRHFARAGATVANASRLAPASLASSSRVGLDFNLPSRGFSSTNVRAYEPKKAGAPVRWAPLAPEKYNGDGWATKHRPATHLLSVQSTSNNVYLTFSDGEGPMFGSVSGGSDKTFKRGKRGEFEASHQAALKMIAKITETEKELRSQSQDQAMTLVVVYKGNGGTGREAVHAALSGAEGAEVRPLIVRLEDHTPIRVGGTRPPGRRRL